MPQVIDADALVQNKKRLPTEAFFVDTNVVIAYADPFSRSLYPTYRELYSHVAEVMHYIKSYGTHCFCTSTVVWEYYVYIQRGFFSIHNAGKIPFNSDSFKHQRDVDLKFGESWALHLKKFRRIFSKNFEIRDRIESWLEIINNFEGLQVDWGDQVIMQQMMIAEKNQHCIFSNDGDFYKFPEEFYLLTTNNKIIEKARDDGRLLKLDK